MKIGDLVEVNHDRLLVDEKPLYAIIVGKDTVKGWLQVRFIDGHHNGSWAVHSYPWANLRLISKS